MRAVVVPALWGIAAVAAATLPAAATARALRGRAMLVLLLVAAASFVTVAGLRQLPLAALVGAGAVTAGLVTAPALLRLRRAARGIAAAGPDTPAPPALRAAAGHPQVAIPLQGTAYAALAGLLVTWTTVSAQATLLPITLATTAGWFVAVLRPSGARPGGRRAVRESTWRLRTSGPATPAGVGSPWRATPSANRAAMGGRRADRWASPAIPR